MTVLRDAELAAAFDHASRSYDVLVAANPGYHAHLRRSVRRLGLPHGGDGLRVLDLGCGTGASTAALAAVLPGAEITAVDASAGMLERAAGKPWPERVTFVHAPAEGLADAGVHGPFDAVFAGYLFRNAADPDAVLASVREVLAPHGRLAVHEYTLSGRARHRAVWTAVCGGLVLPVASALGDGRLYRHLWRSVTEFDTVDRFADRVRAAGFDRVRALPLPGWQTGITHTVVGRRTDDRAGNGNGTGAVSGRAAPTPAASAPAAAAGGRTTRAGDGTAPSGDRADPAGWRIAVTDNRTALADDLIDPAGEATGMAVTGTGRAGARTVEAVARTVPAGARAVPVGDRTAPVDDRAAPAGVPAVPAGEQSASADDARAATADDPIAPAGDR